MNRIDVLLEEYRSLRNEVNQAMNSGNQIMSFGLATMGALVLAGVEVFTRPTSYWIFAVLFPATGLLVLWMWFAELERMSRASHYLSRLEQDINRDLGSGQALHWERWLRSGSKHLWSDAYSGILLFLFFGISPLVYATLCITTVSTQTRVITGAAMASMISILLVSFFMRLMRWQDQLSTIPQWEDRALPPLKRDDPPSNQSGTSSESDDPPQT